MSYIKLKYGKNREKSKSVRYLYEA